MQYKILVYLFFSWVFNIFVCLYHSMCIYKWIWICIIRSVVVEIAAVLWGRNDVDNKIAQTICWQILLYVFFPIPSPHFPLCLFLRVFVEFLEFPVNQQNVSEDLYLISWHDHEQDFRVCQQQQQQQQR